MLNYLPIAGQALQLTAELLFSGFSDYLGTRLPFLLLHSVRHSSTVNNPILIRISGDQYHVTDYFGDTSWK